MKMLDRLWAVLRRRRSDSDLQNELAFHLESEIRRNIASGMAPEEARRQALIAFGGVQQTRERVSEVRWMHFLEVLLQDARFAARLLRKTPLFTAIVVLTLALAIGLNTAIFSLIDAVMFRSLPVSHPDELVLLKWHAHRRPDIDAQWGYGYCTRDNTENNKSNCSLSLPWFKAVRQANVFSGVAGFAGIGYLTLSGNGPATILGSGQLVSGDFFATLGIKAAAGRLLLPDDDTPEAVPAIVLNYAYWQSAFGGSSSAVGRIVRINSQPFTIVGVAEKNFEGFVPGSRPQIWLPLAARPRLVQGWTPEFEGAGAWWLAIVGRVKTGIPATQAQAALNLLFRNETENGGNPLFKPADDPWIELAPAQQALGQRAQAAQPLFVLMAAVALVLLIACANIGGLLLARATGRTREIAVRLTLGAKRSRLISQLLMESLMLSLAGGALGILIGRWGARLWLVLSQSNDSRASLSPQLDSRVLAFTAAVAIGTAILFGLAPILRSLRVDLTPALKSGSGAVDTSDSRRRWYSTGNALVMMQVMLAMVTLVSAGLLVRTLRNLKSVDLGFDPSNVLVFSLNPQQAGYQPAQLDSLYRDLQQRFAALPGVQSVTYSWTSLLGNAESSLDIHPPETPDKTKADVQILGVGPHFFEVMRLPLKLGRDFESSDFAVQAARAVLPPGKEADPKSPPLPVIVNEKFAKRFLAGRNPLGQHIEEGLPEEVGRPRGPGWVIVGVSGDAKYDDLRSDIAPTMYMPCVASAGFSIRASRDPKQLVAAIRDVIIRRDSNLAMYGITTESEQIDQQVFMEKLMAQLCSFFGMLAVALACAGIYGLLSYEVTRRTREIGIRMAVGAQRNHVLGMVIRQGLILASAGTVAGCAASLGASRLLKSLLYQVKDGDPVTLLAVSVLLLAVSIVACWLPARRATRVDPLVALRYE
ncbi:MAG TPA: ABC transporter permease [Candidatus Acidoferrales bacterium]|nr:ABC transporter permease [Candidatus Acidoferrales bacterium]